MWFTRATTTTDGIHRIRRQQVCSEKCVNFRPIFGLPGEREIGVERKFPTGGIVPLFSPLKAPKIDRKMRPSGRSLQPNPHTHDRVFRMA